MAGASGALIRISVLCQSCDRLLDEPPDLPAEQRQPCPACGSLGRERTVLMVPGEANPAPGSPEQAWLDFGSALARAASALDVRADEETGQKAGDSFDQARGEIQKALDEYRDANRRLLSEDPPEVPPT